MKIIIETIPHSEQRYPTLGDWQFTAGGDLNIRVSETGNNLINFLLARHELDEAMLCRAHGVSEKAVDEYDFSHPDAGGDCLSANTDAPYYKEHCDALAAEWVMAWLLGVDWREYTKVLEAVVGD